MNKKSRYIGFLFTIVVIVVCFMGIIFDLKFFGKTEVDNPYDIEISDYEYRKILVLNSYSQDSGIAKKELAAVDKVFSEKNLKYDVEYLKVNYHGISEDSKNAFEKLLAFRIKDYSKYKVILVTDEPAMDFVREYDIFKEVPVVGVGISDLKKDKDLRDHRNFIELRNKTDYSKILKIAYGINPSINRVIAVTSNSDISKLKEKRFKKDVKKTIGFPIDFVDGTDMKEEDIKSFMKKVKSNDLVFILSMENMSDIHKTYKLWGDCAKKYSKVPIYSNLYGFVGYGITGGVVSNKVMYARRGAKICSELVNGNKYVSMRGKDIYEDIVFDKIMMDKYHISPTEISDQSVILNLRRPFLQNYRVEIAASLYILLVVIIFFIKLEYDSRKRKKLELELKSSEDDLFKQYYYDSVTGLPTRRGFINNIKNMTKDEKKKLSVLICDIQGMKYINEKYGHEVGDHILKAMAVQLREFAEKTNTFLGHHGSDSYILMYSSEVREDEEYIADLWNAVNFTYKADDVLIVVKSNIGIFSCCDKLTEDTMPEERIVNAEFALAEAKKSGIPTMVWYDESRKMSAKKEMKLWKIIDDELENDGFELVYQPQVALNPLRMVGCEALARMRDYDISPALFIPAAEKTGSICGIGRIITEKAIKQIVKWDKQGYDNISVSINYSIKQMKDTGYLEFLKNLLEKYKISADRIVMEVTETVFISNSSEAIKFIEEVKKMGISIALDDFGTGYTAIGNLNYIPADIVKIDKSIVDNSLGKGKDYVIEDIVRLLENLNFEILVEGVETKEQYIKLKNMNVNYIQGYYFGKPVKPELIPKYIDTIG